jgi:tRNA(Ile)-lysidine synthase
LIFVLLTEKVILERVRNLERRSEPPDRYVIAFSGGVDSTVLLHALARTADSHGRPVLAIHIDHGLHADSAHWAKHCRRVAETLGVEFMTRRVAVTNDAGFSVEAAAREARYGVFYGLVQAGDWLLSAHHEDDQAETMLLNLFRGSGLAGLAGIGTERVFGAGKLLRPLLGIAAADLLHYAKTKQLDWIEDPSNADLRFDRNFLRQRVLPVLAERWPAVSARIRQSAELAGEASELLNDLAAADLRTLGNSSRLCISRLGKLNQARQRNVLRYAIRVCGLPPAPATRLFQVVHELIPARADAQPLVSWPGGEVRRHRDRLYVLAPTDLQEGDAALRWADVDRPLDLGAGQGQLTLVPVDGVGIRRELASAGLTVRYRKGGEAIRAFGQAHTQKLKKMLQERSVVPWMRHRVPLLCAGDTLVAVADMWLAADAAVTPGLEVRWDRGPALY